MADDPFTVLVSILQDRDIAYDRDALLSTFQHPDRHSAIQDWMEEYLSPETLLTKEEASLYATLTRSGEADRLAAQDLSAIQGLNDQEVQDAIEELKRSTAAIEKQSESLRLQQNAMNALIKSGSRTYQVRTQMDKEQVRKWDLEQEQLRRAIAELSQSLQFQTQDLEQQSKAIEAGFKQSVETILKSDDKLLLSLQKLASDLDPSHPEDEDVIGRIRELCARLIKHTVEAIRTKLDRIYLDALGNSSDEHHNSKDAEASSLQEELESLYSEILPVAQMSVEQQYLEPALRKIAETTGQGQQRSVKAVEYIDDCLNFLVNRVETFLDRAEESKCHRMALHSIIDYANKELWQPGESVLNRSTSPSRSNTQKRRVSSVSQSPLRPRPNRRRSSGTMDDNVEPEQQLARNLGISLPADTTSDQSRSEAFQRIFSDRMRKLDIHASSLQSTTETSISSHLLDAHVTLQLLRDSLLSDSPYHKVELLDPAITTSIMTFEQDVQDLQQSLEFADLHKLRARNVRREQFVERWSR